VRETFEQAILDEPDELSHYAAYADWLQEQGDPRGEFIRVQFELEDEKRPASERRALQAREGELLHLYESDWLGELAPRLLDRNTPDWLKKFEPHLFYLAEHRWRLGFLSSLDLPSMTMEFAQCLATAPAARFLRVLSVQGDPDYRGVTSEQLATSPRVPIPPGVHRYWELLELIGAPFLRGLRVFRIGDPEGEPPAEGHCQCYTYAPGLEHVVAAMLRVEELHLLCKEYDVESLFALPNLSHLRVLRVYHLGVRGNDVARPRYEYPLDVLAANSALANLTHLLFHPHQDEYHPSMYDESQRTDRSPSFLPLEQVRALVRSPHLSRLTHLQLRLSNIGDDGVREIINSGILARLKWLDLRHGCITDAGARLLANSRNAQRLEYLDLSRNAVTDAGLALLRSAGVPALADNPLRPSELEDQQYLFEGDSE
jgi:uncharacterized protein (TIGR02996 family)